MKNIIYCILLLPYYFYSQINQIKIDGQFQDWENVYTIEDELNDVESGVDFKSISITNDNKYLYIKFETTEDIDLLDTGFEGEDLYNLEIFIFASIAPQ